MSSLSAGRYAESTPIPGDLIAFNRSRAVKPVKTRAEEARRSGVGQGRDVVVGILEDEVRIRVVVMILGNRLVDVIEATDVPAM